MRSWKKFLLAVALCAVAGCSETWTDAEFDGPDAPRPAAQPVTPPEDVVLTGTSSIAGKTFTVLGELEVHVNKTTALHPAPTKEAVEDALRAEASKAGADAVINVQIEGPYISAFSWGTMKGTGTAVAFK